MSLDYIRDYATEAFRFYAKMGKPSYEAMKTRIYQEALERERRRLESEIHSKALVKPVEQAVINAERELDKREAELLDILAIEKVMVRLSTMQARVDGQGIRQAVEIVYFTAPEQKLKRGDIIDRVRRACIELPADERTVYRYLKMARRMFAQERGLRSAE